MTNPPGSRARHQQLGDDADDQTEDNPTQHWLRSPVGFRRNWESTGRLAPNGARAGGGGRGWVGRVGRRRGSVGRGAGRVEGLAGSGGPGRGGGRGRGSGAVAWGVAGGAGGGR